MTEQERFERYKAAERGIEYERFKLICDINAENCGVRYHQYSQMAKDWEVWQAAAAQAVPQGFIVMPIEATKEMYYAFNNKRLMSHSLDDEDSFYEDYKVMIKAVQESE